ncbi:uncharacterized protein EV422DRAFT_61106 [Fimicolochytrium jonesii]|uniref:uncharacterized protein n=1 Tax=Fimicolochytrium jonesii TaxID=1396493 RepID=UPI0022FDC6B4|nr:uncharacterized protein EV422DRAFT_61106 [Fimicolochytrium jonesii]KAI8820730.1 hypothetical protein EV422DRAFT_61106 [Fimicolochytrium jonesii]
MFIIGPRAFLSSLAEGLHIPKKDLRPLHLAERRASAFYAFRLDWAFTARNFVTYVGHFTKGDTAPRYTFFSFSITTKRPNTAIMPSIDPQSVYDMLKNTRSSPAVEPEFLRDGASETTGKHQQQSQPFHRPFPYATTPDLVDQLTVGGAVSTAAGVYQGTVGNRMPAIAVAGAGVGMTPRQLKTKYQLMRRRTEEGQGRTPSPPSTPFSGGGSAGPSRFYTPFTPSVARTLHFKAPSEVVSSRYDDRVIVQEDHSVKIPNF